jgi:hypothetical protein
MIVYTVLFTLVGKDPAENRYVEMFYIWLTYLIKNGDLGPTDKICIILDKCTVDFINSEFILKHILNLCNIPIEFWLIPQPRTLSEGMVHKYSLEEIPAIVSECSLYIDLDITVVSSLRPMREVIPDTIAVVIEGNLNNDDYGGQLITREKREEGYPGFSAAIFAFSSGKYVKNFMRRVKGDCLAQDPPFYTVEQPFFNKYLYEMFINGDRNFFILPEKYVAINDITPSDSVVFVNYCGDPGNGPRHIVKMIMAMCMELLLTHPRTEPTPVPQHPAPPLGPAAAPPPPAEPQALDEGQAWPAPSEA